MTLLRYAVVLLLAGCASNSGVAPIGPDTFMVSRQAAIGFSGAGQLEAEALREANQYCLKHTKVLHIVAVTEARPPYSLTNFPRVDVQFKCLIAGVD